MQNCTCSSQSQSTTSLVELEMLAGVFKALGHPVRLMIVEMLIDGERCVCELQENSKRDMSTISSHLNILKNNGVVKGEQRGKNVYYTLACPCLTQVIACLKDHCSVL